MTMKELSQLSSLSNEIELLITEKTKIEKDLRNMEVWASDVVNGSDLAFPFSPRHYRTTGLKIKKGKEQDYKQRKNKLIELHILLEEKQKERVAEYERLLRYVTEVDDSYIRQILQLRFLNGLTWQQVATGVGGNNTEDSVKKAAYRFIGKQNSPTSPEI